MNNSRQKIGFISKKEKANKGNTWIKRKYNKGQKQTPSFHCHNDTF